MGKSAAVRILAAGDLHLGMRFAKYPEVSKELSDARYAALDHIVSIANEKRCDLVVIAGDLFDRVNVAKQEVLRGVEILNSFKGKVICVLPGNHDHYSGRNSSLWSSFREGSASTVLFLGQKKPYSLRDFDLDCLVLPGPCESKHSPLHALSWIAEQDIEGDHHLILGVAHGSVEGISPDFDEQYYPMKLDLFDSLPASVWIIGHTHHAREEKLKNCTVVFPGTPEPDGFDFTRKGMASCIDVENGKAAAVEQIETGTYLFRRETRDITGIEDLEGLAGRVYGDKTLLKLILTGRIPADAYQAVTELRKNLSKIMLYSEIDDSVLFPNITREMVEKEFSRGSFPHRLMSELLKEGDTEALHTAYNLLMEAKE